MKYRFALLLLLAEMLGGVAAAPVFAQDLPCQEENVQMDYYARRMYGDGYTDAEYDEFEAQTDTWEKKLVACLDDYERANGAQARADLDTRLIEVTQQINDARKGM